MDSVPRVTGSLQIRQALRIVGIVDVRADQIARYHQSIHVLLSIHPLYGVSAILVAGLGHSFEGIKAPIGAAIGRYLIAQQGPQGEGARPTGPGPRLDEGARQRSGDDGAYSLF